MSKRTTNQQTFKRKPCAMSEAVPPADAGWSWEGAVCISSVGSCSLPTWQVSLSVPECPSLLQHLWTRSSWHHVLLLPLRCSMLAPLLLKGCCWPFPRTRNKIQQKHHKSISYFISSWKTCFFTSAAGGILTSRQRTIIVQKSQSSKSLEEHKVKSRSDLDLFQGCPSVRCEIHHTAEHLQDWGRLLPRALGHITVQDLLWNV